MFAYLFIVLTNMFVYLFLVLNNLFVSVASRCLSIFIFEAFKISQYMYVIILPPIDARSDGRAVKARFSNAGLTSLARVRDQLLPFFN